LLRTESSTRQDGFDDLLDLEGFSKGSKMMRLAAGKTHYPL
jgi:hypothetical protein